MEKPCNLVELVATSCKRHAERPLFGTKRNGVWSWVSYAAFGELIDRCRAGLHARGVGRDDVVAIVANNCMEWAVACYAAQSLGAVIVPLYQAQQPAEWKYILQDCRSKLVFARAGEPYAHIAAMRPELPAIEHLVGIDLPVSDPDSFAALLEAGSRTPVAPFSPEPARLAAIVYTSGTTGRPKGVELTHSNLTSNALTAASEFPLSPEDRLLSFLPWAHCYGQLELNYAIAKGASLALNDDIKQLLPNLAEVRPTMLVTVPRIFHRVYEAARAEMAKRPKFVQKLFEDGIRCAARRSRGERVGVLRRLELRLDDRLIFRKIRAHFGGRLKYVICASAALGTDVAHFVDALGIEVYEGYGLTETSPMVTANFPGARRLGSVGRVVRGVRVVIDTQASSVPEQGEIVVYGPNVMRGYHNRPEENARVFTPDGGLRTGDLGYMDKDGYLYITGRIKEQYKLANGKYVTPGPLEEELRLSRFVSQVMLYGANRPYNVALVALDVPAVRAWADEYHIHVDDPAHHPSVEELIRAEVQRLSSHFRSYEIPHRVLITAEDFTTDNDMLTPTLKLKRGNAEHRYGEALDALYQADVVSAS